MLTSVYYNSKSIQINMNNVNFWSILVSSIVTFLITSIWYSKFLFGKEWAMLNQKSDSDLESSQKGIWKSYLTYFIATIITFCVLGFVINSVNVTRAIDGSFFGFLLWLGFVAPTILGDYLWNNSTFRLFLINSIPVLINLIIGGAIIVGWR